MPNFKKFIMDASKGSCKTPANDPEKLIRGFYCIVSQKNYNDPNLKAYITAKGYTITQKELDKVRNLVNSTELLFKIHNRDY